MIYVEFTPEMREWLKTKAEEDNLNIQEFINQLISEEMNKQDFLSEGKSNKYREFIKEYLQIIRKL
jgi:hypothetical protein